MDVAGDEVLETLRGRLPGAHQAVRHHARIELRALRQRPHRQGARDSHPHLPGEQLVEEEDLPQRHRVPQRQDRLALLRLAGVAQGQQPGLDQLGERQPLRPRRPAAARGVDEQRDDLRQVAGRRPALAEHPVGRAGLLHRPGGEQPRRDQPLEAGAGEEEDRPGRVGRRRLGEVRLHRRDLLVGRGGRVELFVELGEAAHQSPSGSAAREGPVGAVSTPCSRSQRTKASR